MFDPYTARRRSVASSAAKMKMRRTTLFRCRAGRREPEDTRGSVGRGALRLFPAGREPARHVGWREELREDDVLRGTITRRTGPVTGQSTLINENAFRSGGTVR